MVHLHPQTVVLLARWYHLYIMVRDLKNAKMQNAKIKRIE
jgi:hypothetical protein